MAFISSLSGKKVGKKLQNERKKNLLQQFPHIEHYQQLILLEFEHLSKCNFFSQTSLFLPPNKPGL